MTDVIANRINEMVSNAVGFLRKGHPEAAARLLHRAIGTTPPGESVARLVKAMDLCKTNPGHAVCTINGHDHVGGPTCYHCGSSL